MPSFKPSSSDWNCIHLINQRLPKDYTKDRGKKRRNLKSIQEKWAVNVEAFFMDGMGAAIKQEEEKGLGAFKTL